jgi:hypothetical protein
MTLALATIPDDPDALIRWLEGHLVGAGLRALAAELAAVHSAVPSTDSIRARLGPHLSAVLERGLSALPPTEIRHLLHQPYHLLELQQIVLLEGGPYWDTVPRSGEFLDRGNTGRARLGAELFGPPAEPLAEPPARRRSWRMVWVVAATAGLVFIVTFAGTRWLVPRGPAAEPSWGWARAGAFAKDLDRAVYLNRLADEADEWFAQRPADAPAAARRIAEFRAGCTALLMADHAPLPPADREWLKERCRLWRKALDEHLARLEDTGDAAAALAATDATVHQLGRALRTRATSG